MRASFFERNVVGNYSGQFKLNDDQLNRLALHHIKLLELVISYLDRDFKVGDKDANWPMLGHHYIELLKSSDQSAFQKFNEKILEMIIKTKTNGLPFLFPSMADLGAVDNEDFLNHINEVISTQTPEGIVHFYTSMLHLGDDFSTLWALRVLASAGLDDKYTREIDLAINGLSNHVDNVLSRKIDWIGFFLFVLTLLDNDTQKYDKLINQCLDKIPLDITKWKSNHWVDDIIDMRTSGFLSYDLIHLIAKKPSLLAVIEKWLINVFDLDIKELNMPVAFSASQRKFPEVDIWLQGWLRALITATLYLKLRIPNYSPVQYILPTIVDGNSYSYEAKMLWKLLPNPEEIKAAEPFLVKFWRDSEFHKSVFLMRWMGQSKKDISTNKSISIITETIIKELSKYGLIGRYVEDKPSGHYSSNLYLNNITYMRGCKYGIAIIEKMQRAGKMPDSVNSNVVFEIGFMFGKGSKVLILYDSDTMQVGEELPALLQDALYEKFKSESHDGIESAIKKWAEGLTENKDTPEEN